MPRRESLIAWMATTEGLLFREYLKVRKDELTASLLGNLLLDARLDSSLKAQIKLYDEIMNFSEMLKNTKTLEQVKIAAIAAAKAQRSS